MTLKPGLVPAILRHPWMTAPVYGVLVFMVMNLVVIPLSAAGKPSFAWPILANGILIHVFGVGVPSVWAARTVPIVDGRSGR